MNALAHTRFFLDPTTVHLNHGSFGAAPRVVIEARRAWEDRIEADPVGFLWDEVEAELTAVAHTIASFVGANGQDVALVENATTGVNTVLRSLQWQPGDRVVLLSHRYDAVYNSVQFLAERFGVQIDIAELPFPYPGDDAALDALNAVLPGARFAVLDHITSPTGLVLPIERMVQACQTHGVPVLVDGAHAPGQVPLNLTDLDCDYYTGNLHKWAFAARGTALLWVNPKAPELNPLVVSHGWKGSLHQRLHWPGTRDFSGWLAAPTALQFWQSLGGADLMARNRQLARECGDALASRWRCELPSPPHNRAALCAVPLPSPVPLDACRAFSRTLYQEHRIEVPIIPFAGRSWVRFSIQAYNDAHDVQRVAEAIEACLR
ncbi:MAG: aminotransferase class V-fold PLP-dependent enzyme [Myxococcota bacterium]